jgi:hypothetical protein
MLPPINIERSPTYLDRGGDTEPCAICGKPVNHETAKWVGANESFQAVDPSIEEPPLGCFPIGPECWRKHKQLHPYARS